MVNLQPNLQKYPLIERMVFKSPLYYRFLQEGKSQATLEISWTPQNGTPLRETVIVKLGSLKSQLNLVATCKCPPAPKVSQQVVVCRIYFIS